MHAHATIDAVKSRPSVQRSKKDGGHFFSGLRVQPKLTVGPVNDVYEQEADAVADRVMRMSDRDVVQTHAAPPLVQMKCAHCEEEEKLQKKDDEEQMLQKKSFAEGSIQRKCAACEAEEHKVQKKPAIVNVQKKCSACEEEVHRKAIAPVMIQKKCAACEEEESVHRKESGIGQVTVSDSVHQTLNSAGRPLDTQTLNFMESRFDYDFSSVQIHDDPTANRSSRDIQARAYTHGKHIAFAAGEFQPHTPSGKTLLAHELTHVIQQGSNTIKRKDPSIQRDPDPQKGMSRADEIKLSMTSPGEFEVSVKPITISVFNFGIDKFDLKAEHKTALDAVAFLLKKLPHDKWTILVEGNADITGTKEINDPLARNRANTVKKYLKSKSGESFPAIGFGADLPITTNENVTGRNRNRRVDILFFPPPIKKPVCEHPPCEEKKPNPCDIPIIARLFCKGGLPCVDAGWIESIICIALLCLLTPLAEICACALDPFECLPGGRSKKKKKKACPTLVELPSGNLPMHSEWPILTLPQPFTMKIEFMNDDTGCDCSCGEYKQEVKGFFETEFMNGQIENSNDNNPKHWHLLSPSTRLEPNTFHEDGSKEPDSGYGHRGHRSRTGAQISPREWDVIDFFSPTQANGCLYRGQDNPGFLPLLTPENQRRRTYYLDFKGGPVTAASCSGGRSYLPGYLHEWHVGGEIVRPPVAPGTGPTPGGTGPGGPTPGGKVKAIRATPKVTTHKGNQPIRTTYQGGLPIDAPVKSIQSITFTFDVDGSPDPYYYTIKVQVLENNPDSIKVVTINNNSLNLAPPGKPEIIINAHRVVKVPKSVLK